MQKILADNLLATCLPRSFPEVRSTFASYEYIRVSGRILPLTKVQGDNREKMVSLFHLTTIGLIAVNRISGLSGPD